MGDHWTRRVWCCASFGEILLIGEQLRIQMHTDHPDLIKDRRQLFKTYSSCFSGNECVDWLLGTKQVPTRDMAVVVMNILLENSIIHHVNDSQSFRDDSNLYRFRKDDSTYPWCDDLAIVLRGQRLFSKLTSESNSTTVVSTRAENGKVYTRSFQGCSLIDWLVETKEAEDNEAALQECRNLLQHDVIRHVTDSHHFKHEPLLYQFKIDFSHKWVLLDLVIPPEIDHHIEADAGNGAVELSTSTGSTAKDIPAACRDRPTRSESGYHSDHLDSSQSPGSFGREASPEAGLSELAIEDPGAKLTTSQISQQRLLYRKATSEELESDYSPYVKRQLRVPQDPVGYGFVIRGEGPVFVKTVDPMGPAAAAGLKVGQYIYSINDRRVLDMNHKDLAHVILGNQTDYLTFVVMTHKEDIL